MSDPPGLTMPALAQDVSIENRVGPPAAE